MQFDRDLNSTLAELFLEVRAYIIQNISSERESVIEKYTKHVTSFYSTEFKNGFCYIKVKGEYLYIGWFKGAFIQDKPNVLFGSGKVLRRQKIKHFGAIEKDAVTYYIQQTRVLLFEHLKHKEISR